MRFAYVAAGAVVLGAVSEAGSVPSSPQRMDKVVKRQNGQPAQRVPLEPLNFGYPMVAKVKKAGPSRVHNEAFDAYNEVGMSKSANVPDAQRQAIEFIQPGEDQNPNPQASASMLAYEPEVTTLVDGTRGAMHDYTIGTIPTDRPENVAKKVAGSRGVGPNTELSSVLKWSLPYPLTEPVYLIEDESKALPESYQEPFEKIYATTPAQILSTTQRLPTDSPIDTLLQGYQIASGQSIPDSPSPTLTGPPALPLSRALSDVNNTVHPSELINSSGDNIIAFETKNVPSKELSAPANDTLLSSQAPLPISRTLQISSGTQDATSLPTPASPPATTPLPATFPSPPDGIALSPGVNTTVGHSERETVSAPTGANGTMESPLTGSIDGLIASDVNTSNQLAGTSSNMPLNTTASPLPSPLSPPSQIPNQK